MVLYVFQIRIAVHVLTRSQIRSHATVIFAHILVLAIDTDVCTTIQMILAGLQ
jgi:hypothetical protein